MRNSTSGSLVGGQPLPVNARLEIDRRRGRRARSPARCGRRARRRGRGPAGGLGVGEEVAHRQAEDGDEPPERADRRVDLVVLDLRDEARRDADAARDLADGQALALALLAEPLADPGGLETLRQPAAGAASTGSSLLGRRERRFRAEARRRGTPSRARSGTNADRAGRAQTSRARGRCCPCVS